MITEFFNGLSFSIGAIFGVITSVLLIAGLVKLYEELTGFFK